MFIFTWDIPLIFQIYIHILQINEITSVKLVNRNQNKLKTYSIFWQEISKSDFLRLYGESTFVHIDSINYDIVVG